MQKSENRNNLMIEEISKKLSPLFENEEIELCILFGSLSTGRGHKKSDIDLAFLYEKQTDILALTNEVITLLKTDNIDIIDLKHSSPLLKYAAAKTGTILYEKCPGTFNKFYSLSFRMYIDSKKLFSAQQQFIDNFLISKGLR